MNSWDAIIGVLIGAMIGFGIDYFRELRKNKNLKSMLKKELNSIQFQIEQKKDIIKQILVQYDKGKILSGNSVGIINTGYKNNISDLYSIYSSNERNALHVIYDTLGKIDAILLNFERDYYTNIHAQFRDQELNANLIHLREALGVYDRMNDLIEEFISGNVDDVFQLEPLIQEDKKKETIQ